LSVSAPLQPQSSPCRVLIAAVDPLVRSGLVSLVASAELLEEAADPTSADVAIADGMAALRRTEVPAVVLVDDVPGPQALAEGARGVLPRDATAESVVAAILAVRAGLTVLDAALSEAAVPAGDAPDDDEALTRREQEVVRLLAEGLSNKEIAANLGISPHTAKFHVNGILQKLHAGTRTEAVVRAAQRGWLLI